ncbi:MAG TPA: AI-2E family transporter [Terracidiphilus sp.]
MIDEMPSVPPPMPSAAAEPSASSMGAQAPPAAPQVPRSAFDWSGLTLFLITIAAVLFCFLIAWPFLPGITAAVVLAIVTQRPFRWLAARLGNRTLASSVALVLVVLSVVVPSVLLIASAGSSIIQAVRALQSGSATQALADLLANHPQLNTLWTRVLENIDSGQVVEKTAGIVAARLGAFLGESVTALVQLVVMLFILFFLYRDGDEAIRFAHSLLPLEPEENSFLLERIRTAITALVLGRFAVAAIQGVAAGITYALLGLSSAVVLGVATTLLALVPAVGAVSVWLPVVGYLALTHHWLEASLLFAIGALFISTLDNILYPLLVGNHLKLHAVPIFLAMLGGVLLFGVTGIVLGPVLFNATGSLVLILRHRAKGEPLPTEPEPAPPAPLSPTVR